MNDYFEHGQYSAEEIEKGVWHLHDATRENPAGLHPDKTFNNSSSMYVLDCGSEVLLIDCGNPYEDDHLRELVTILAGIRPVRVFITHQHFDHVGGLKQFQDCPVYAMENIAGYDVHILADQEELTVGNRVFQALAVPGHTPDSMALYEKSTGLLACGDAFGSGAVWLFFMEDVLNIYSRSLDHLLRHTSENLTLLCGHRYQHLGQGQITRPVMARDYLIAQKQLVQHILQGQATAHPYNALNRDDLVYYRENNAEIDTYPLGGHPVIL